MRVRANAIQRSAASHICQTTLTNGSLRALNPSQWDLRSNSVFNWRIHVANRTRRDHALSRSRSQSHLARGDTAEGSGLAAGESGEGHCASGFGKSLIWTEAKHECKFCKFTARGLKEEQ